MRNEDIASKVRRAASSEDGAVAVLAAAFMLIGVAAAALAVDLGALHLERRAAQGAADLAAIAATRDLDRAEAAASATLQANGVDRITKLVVERGAYTPDQTVEQSLRFAPGKQPFNAVRVRVEKTGRTYFAHAFNRQPVDMSVSATAATSAIAGFSIGSRLAAVRDGVANALLGALLGGDIDLSVADYNALVDADIGMFQFLDALATNVDVTAGTYDDVLQANATVGDVIAAAAAATQAQGNSAATVALEKLARQSNAGSLTAPVAQFIDLGPLGSAAIGSPTSAFAADFGVMQLISGAATLANGEHQATIDLGAEIPGLLSLKLDVAIGERPQSSAWAAVGEAGAEVRTAQIRLRLTAEVGGAAALMGTKVRLPVAIDIAYAEGRLAKITCSDSDAGAVDVAVQPGVADVWIAEIAPAAMADFSAPMSTSQANIVNAPLIKVKGQAHVEAGSSNETILSFSQDDIDNGTIKRAGSSGLAQSLVSSLISDLKLNVSLLGLGLGLPSAVTAAVGATLQPIAAPLDGVVDTLLKTLGVSVGEADVRVLGVRCGAGVLAG